MVVTSREQEQASGDRVPDHQGQQIGGELAVLAVEVSPSPQAQHNRRRHFDRGEGDECLHGAAHQDAAGESGARRRIAWRRISLRPEAGKNASDEAQVVERPAIGGRGLPRTPVPIDVLVQRQGVRHVDDQTAVILTHPACLRWAVSDTGSHTARAMCFYFNWRSRSGNRTGRFFVTDPE